MYVPQSEVEKVLKLAQMLKTPFRVFDAGYIKKSETKKVVINPVGITFSEDELQVR